VKHVIYEWFDDEDEEYDNLDLIKFATKCGDNLITVDRDMVYYWTDEQGWNKFEREYNQECAQDDRSYKKMKRHLTIILVIIFYAIIVLLPTTIYLLRYFGADL